MAAHTRLTEVRLAISGYSTLVESDSVFDVFAGKDLVIPLMLVPYASRFKVISRESGMALDGHGERHS